MEKYFTRQLCPDALALIDQINSVSSKVITFAPRPNIASYACRETTTHWEILAPRVDRLNNGSVIHELLHVRRFTVDNIPRLEPSMARIGDTDFENNLTTLDNGIEHLEIVNEEIRMWPSRRGYWGKKMHRELCLLNVVKNIGPNEKAHIILCWLLVLRAVPSKKLLRGWDGFMKESGIEAEIDGILNTLSHCHDKLTMVNTLLSVLRIPANQVELF